MGGAEADDRVMALLDHHRVVDAERAVHIHHEAWFPSLVIDHERLVDLANWVYIYGHWPVIGITLVRLFLRGPDDYRLLRNAMFVSGAIGLVVARRVVA